MKSRSGSSASSGRLMDKGDLLKLVYSDTIVEENAIAKNVSTLRKVLAGDPKVLERLPRVNGPAPGSHECVDRTLVHRHATGNEVPPPLYRGYAGLPVRRLAGVLAGRPEPTPALPPGHVSSGSKP